MKKKRANLEKGALDKKGGAKKGSFAQDGRVGKGQPMSVRVILTSECGEERTLVEAKKRLVRFLIWKGKVEVKEKEKNFLEIAAPKKNNTFLAHEIKMALLM